MDKKEISLYELFNLLCEDCSKSKVMWILGYNDYPQSYMYGCPPRHTDFSKFVYLCGRCYRKEIKINGTSHLTDSIYRLNEDPITDFQEIIIDELVLSFDLYEEYENTHQFKQITLIR